VNKVSPQGGTERYGACGDESAPGEVTQAQLDELSIAIVRKEEE